MIILICSIVLIMLIWFKSDALIEWGEFFGLSNFLKIHEYNIEKFKVLPDDFNYPTFLKLKYSNILTRLISCPLCFCVWNSFIFCTALSIFYPIFIIEFPVVFIFSFILYGIISIIMRFL